jgi:predicted O-methyltransferase YrrM
MIAIPNEVIFSVLRVLKKANPGDLYYEAYLGHLAKRKETFFDLYHFAWSWAIEHKPKRILEIGTRTGISLCQLLSAYIDTSNIERIVSCDLYNDGFISPELVKYNLSYLGISQAIINKIEFKVGDSKIEIPKLNADSGFDYILVDGDHSKEGAMIDLENASQLIIKDGAIVFDDISPDGMDLLDVWENFKTKHSSEFKFYEDLNGKGVGWCIRK